MNPSPKPEQEAALELARLRRFYDRYERLLKHLPVGVFEVDSLGAGKVLAVNPAGLRLLGYDSIEELQQLSIADLYLHPEDRGEVLARLKASNGQPLQMVMHFRRKDGRPVRTSVILQVVQEDDQPRLFGIVLSLEDRKRIEAELRRTGEERDRLLEAIEIATEAICVVSPEGVMTYTNWGMDRLFGYEKGELVGKSPVILNAGDAEAVAQHIKKKVYEEGFWEGEVPNRRKDGTEFFSYARISALKNANGEFLHYISTQHDITEHKLADEAREKYASRIEGLRRIDLCILHSQTLEQIADTALTHLEALVNCQRASVVAMDADGSRGTVIGVRSQAETDIRVGTRLPTVIFDILKSDDGYACCHVEDIDDLAEPSALDLEIRAEGVRSYMSVPLVADGKLVGALNLGSDRPHAFDEWNRAVVQEVADVLTLAIRQHQLREQAERTTQELERAVAERTRQLGSANVELEYLTSSVVDELQVPLRAVMGLTREMLDWHSSKMSKELALLAGSVQNAAANMKEHLDAIHEFMSIGQRALKRRKLNMHQIVGDWIKQQAQALADRPVRFGVGNLPPAHGDLFLVKSLWSHLLCNAVKFSRNTRSASVNVGAEESSGETVYFIRDNGVGFNMAEANRLFGMFKRLHSLSDFPGHGAGLACAKRIVSRHGGRIWGEGEVGKGATFRFTLPGA